MKKKKNNFPTPGQIATMTQADWKDKLAEMEENLLATQARALHAQFDYVYSTRILERLKALDGTLKFAAIGLTLSGILFIATLFTLPIMGVNFVAALAISIGMLALGLTVTVTSLQLTQRNERKVQKDLAYEDAIKEKLNPELLTAVLRAMGDSPEMNVWFDKELGTSGKEILYGLAENPDLTFKDAVEMARELR